MDIKAFLKLLSKYKWVLILVPILTGTITFFLVKNLPKEYKSEAQIATGIIDQSKQVVVGDNQGADFFKVNQQFANIIERMKMKVIMSNLSYNLILHELENPTLSFKPYSKELDSLNANDKQLVILAYKERLIKRQVNTVGDNVGKYKLFNIIKSMGYDQDHIEEKLNISRQDNSDFINVNYTSANPNLSSFLVNTLASEFINSYGSDVAANQNNSIELLDSLLKKKELAMNKSNAALKEFKMKNGVLNLDKQSEMVYGQISQNEDRKAQALRDIQSNQRAIADIDARLRDGRDNYSGGNSTADNKVIINLKNQLAVANNAYIDGNFKVSDKLKIDSLTRIIDRLSNKISDDNVVNPATSKQALLQQRLALETVVSQAKGSINSIDAELSVLRAKYNTMVPFDAGIQNYERDADLATKDYMTSLDTYNKNRTEQNVALKLQLAQIGLPGLALPSKSIVYVLLSTFVSFFICFSIILALFLLDNKILTSKQLAYYTKSNVLGNLNIMNKTESSIRYIWQGDDGNPETAIYKNLLRSLRFEISKAFEKDNTKILGVTSLGPNEGKSFIASSLAYAFAMMGKKVLLIGGEIAVKKSNSKDLIIRQDFESFLVKKEIQTEDLITVMAKRDDSSSLLEVQNAKNLRAGFEVLKQEFDIVIIDVNSLRDINIAKEWLLFTENNIAVFEAGNALKEQDKSLIDYIQKQPGFIGWVLNKVKLDSVNN